MRDTLIGLMCAAVGIASILASGRIARFNVRLSPSRGAKGDAVRMTLQKLIVLLVGSVFVLVGLLILFGVADVR